MTRPTPPDQKIARGETRPSREIVHLFPDVASRPDPDQLPPPKGMPKPVREIWNTKVARYRQRGQKVDGVQEALQQYCELEYKLRKAWRDKDGPPMAMVNTYRMFASEFFDTPASQLASAKSLNKNNGNPQRHGRPPADVVPPAIPGATAV